MLFKNIIFILTDNILTNMQKNNDNNCILFHVFLSKHGFVYDDPVLFRYLSYL